MMELLPNDDVITGMNRGIKEAESIIGHSESVSAFIDSTYDGMLVLKSPDTSEFADNEDDGDSTDDDSSNSEANTFHSGDIDGVVFLNDDPLGEIESATMAITEADSSIAITPDSKQNGVSTFDLRMDNFREKLQTARSARSSGSLRPASPLGKHTAVNTADISDNLNVLEFSSTLGDSFQLNVVNGSSFDDESSDERLRFAAEPNIANQSLSTNFSGSYAKPLPLYDHGDQVLPDELVIPLPAEQSFTEDNFRNIRKHIASPLLPQYKEDKPKRRLRLVTSESSADGSMLGQSMAFTGNMELDEFRRAADEVMETLRKRRFKEKTIDHNDFQSFEEGDFQTLFLSFDIEPENLNVNEQPQNEFKKDEEKYQYGYFAELHNRDEWVKSLNLAFRIDENISDELIRFDDLDLSCIQSIPSPTKIGTVIETEEKVESLKEEVDKVHKEQYLKPPTTAASLLSFTNEKMVDLFQKFSANIYTGNDADAYGFVEGNKDVLDHGYDEIIVTKDTLNTQSTRNKLASELGIRTAKLFKEDGVSSSNAVDDLRLKRRFVEDMQTIMTIRSEGDNLNTLNKSLGIANNNPGNKGYQQDTNGKDVNGWLLKSKGFKTTKGAPIMRGKPIRRILLSELSKDSVLNDPSNSKDSSTSKLSLSRSILRRKKSGTSRELNKERGPKEFNMDSGASLEGFAAEYASQNDLRFPDSNEPVFQDEETLLRMIEGQVNRSLNGSLAGTMDSKEDDTQTSDLSTSPKSISEYVPTPVPQSRLHKSFSFHSKLNMSENKSSGHELDNKKKLSIRFAPTPEYISNRYLSKKFKKSKKSKKSSSKDDKEGAREEEAANDAEEFAEEFLKKHRNLTSMFFKKFMK